MAVEITGWGCPSYRESVSSQYSLTRPDLWRSSWSWPYQYSRVPHYYCERLPFPRSPLSWSAIRMEMISGQRETSRVSADQDGQMWSWGEQSWSAVEARPKVLESMINGWSRPKRWGIDDQLWWRRRLDKTDKVSWPLINSTECATRTADKDTAVLHSRRLNDSTLRGRWELFSTKM